MQAHETTFLGIMMALLVVNLVLPYFHQKRMATERAQK